MEGGESDGFGHAGLDAAHARCRRLDEVQRSALAQGQEGGLVGLGGPRLTLQRVTAPGRVVGVVDGRLAGTEEAVASHLAQVEPSPAMITTSSAVARTHTLVPARRWGTSSGHLGTTPSPTSHAA